MRINKILKRTFDANSAQDLNIFNLSQTAITYITVLKIQKYRCIREEECYFKLFLNFEIICAFISSSCKLYKLPRTFHAAKNKYGVTRETRRRDKASGTIAKQLIKKLYNYAI